MGTLRTLTFAFLPFLFLISTAISANVDHDTLLGCLTNHSNPSNPIYSAIYTPKSSNFSDILESYIRNLRFNTSTTRKPLLIITALHESHVQAAVVCAREVGALMKIRSGGHDYEGISYVSDTPFFILDMFKLRSIEVNVEEETAWVQAGATLGEVYYRIFEKSTTHGFPAGVCPTVGAGGHFSGGGYGNMMRKYGLSVDHIVDAILVDVTGRVLNRTTMGEDLFWAIRGGGGASFGVIVSYKLNLVKVPEKVTVFKIQRLMEDDALDVVMQWQGVASNVLPHELFIRLTQDVVNSTKNPNNMTVRATFRALYLGDSKSLLSVMEKYIPLMKANESDVHELRWVDSVSFWTDFPLGTPATALLSRTPQSLTYLKRKSDYIKKVIPRDGLEFVWERMIELQTPQLTFNPYGGRMAEIPATETPFPHRAGNLFKVQYATNWNVGGANNSEYYIGLTRKLYGYMTPYVSKGPREAFLNYRDLDLGINHQGKGSYYEARRYGIKYFKANFERLVEVKAKVDPTNFFRNEQSIPLPPKH
ncbi:hypothetical protein V2J09_011229 [Rumex salicifolius]